MITVSLDPILVHLGPFALSWYGLAIAAAVAAAVWLVFREAARKGLPTEPLGDLTIWIIAGGFVGARLLHVIDRWDVYGQHPALILAVWNGGLAILGAVLGGTLAGVVGAWRLGLPVRRLSDAVAPGLILGQAIGRFGCLTTGDSVGPATDGTWGIAYTNPHALVPQLGVPYQPTFFYEQLGDVAIFAILWLLRKRLRGDGQLFALYLGLYATLKFALTFLRTETIWVAGLQEAQLLALAAMAVAALWVAWPQAAVAGARRVAAAGPAGRLSNP